MIHKVYKIIYPIGTIRFRHTKNRPGYYKKVQARGIPADWQLIKPATEPNQQELDELIAQNKKDTLGKKTVADIGKEHYQKIEDRYNNDPEFRKLVNSHIDILSKYKPSSKDEAISFFDEDNEAEYDVFNVARYYLRKRSFEIMGFDDYDYDFLRKIEESWCETSTNIVDVMAFINEELGRDRTYGFDDDAKDTLLKYDDFSEENETVSRYKDVIRAQIAYSRFVHNKLFPKGVKVYRGIRGDQAHDIISSLKTNGVAYVDNRPLSSASLTKDVADDFANTRKAIVVDKLVDSNSIFSSMYTSDKLVDSESEFIIMQGRFKFKDKSFIVSS